MQLTGDLQASDRHPTTLVVLFRDDEKSAAWPRLATERNWEEKRSSSGVSGAAAEWREDGVVERRLAMTPRSVIGQRCPIFR
jgi:hypothetical protein